MTNSYNSSQRPKIVIFHGLNNNPQGFGPLRSELEKFGFETEMIILPCHGENRHEARNAEEALDVFTESMKKLQGQKYHAIAFSHGALYLQLWMEKGLDYPPGKQVLLAPALYIRKQSLIVQALKILPSFISVMSLQPKRFRRYNILSAREYNILVQGIVSWQKLKSKFRIPTKVMIDPEDELVNAHVLKQEIEKLNKVNVELMHRPDLAHGLGAHHIIFHPDYFSPDSWEKFLKDIIIFFETD